MRLDGAQREYGRADGMGRLDRLGEAEEGWRKWEKRVRGGDL